MKGMLLLLPDYTIRESARAKHIRFKVTVADGLVVVIPKGFGRKQIPELLKAKQRWLMRALNEIEKHRAAMPASDQRPTTIELPAINQTWQLDWVETTETRITISEMGESGLRITGPIQDVAAWQSALRQWLIECGRETLIPWTQDLSQELGIPIQRVTVRCQKTRWGSYSSKGTVSLNAQLLLLPRRLVRYVLIHELCHATHPNHSPRFWHLVQQWEPAADRLRSELKPAWRLVPSWIQSIR
jgi:predicted metal-dependent hydrolase